MGAGNLKLASALEVQRQILTHFVLPFNARELPDRRCLCGQQHSQHLPSIQSQPASPINTITASISHQYNHNRRQANMRTRQKPGSDCAWLHVRQASSRTLPVPYVQQDAARRCLWLHERQAGTRTRPRRCCLCHMHARTQARDQQGKQPTRRPRGALKPSNALPDLSKLLLRLGVSVKMLQDASDIAQGRSIIRVLVAEH